MDICRAILQKHSRVLFSKDGYSEEWLHEAKKRGLPNIPHYLHSIDSLIAEESVKMFERNGVYNKTELEARVDILIEEYRKSVKVEVLTLLDVSKKDILPALVKEIQFYADAQNALGKTNAYFTRKLDYLLSLLDKLDNAYHTLKKAMEERNKTKNSREKAYYLDEVVVPMINSLGDIIDKVEEAISRENYPFPTYDDMFLAMQ